MTIKMKKLKFKARFFSPFLMDFGVLFKSIFLLNFNSEGTFLSSEAAEFAQLLLLTFFNFFRSLMTRSIDVSSVYNTIGNKNCGFVVWEKIICELEFAANFTLLRCLYTQKLIAIYCCH